jgi:hydroxybutyrate-dimer hydrolase
VLYKHAHSGDNPEADWGRHVIQAASFGLQALALAFPEQAPFTPENTRLIAFGISNGGGAVLRAAELPEAAWFEAMIAGEPNVTVAGVRPLYDVSTEAALYQPCILLDPRIADAAWPVPPGALSVAAALRCASLASAGMLGAGTPVQQAAEGYDRLRASGWDEGALALAPTSVMFDLWRAVGATYAAAYARTGTGPMPCGYAFGAVDPTGKARATLASERALWWSDSAGVAPSAGVMIVDGKAAAPDPALPGLQCLRALWQGDDATARAVKAGVEAVRGSGAVKSKRVAVVHGRDDGLVPAAFTSRPWSLSAHAQTPGADIRYYEVEHAQHFDAFLGLPAYGARYVPLIPYLWRLLDLTLEKSPLPPEGKVATRPRGAGAGGVPPALTKDNLGDWFR